MTAAATAALTATVSTTAASSSQPVLASVRTFVHSAPSALGLAIVRAIAAAHKATVTATARPDGGLDFEVSFP